MYPVRPRPTRGSLVFCGLLGYIRGMSEPKRRKADDKRRTKFLRVRLTDAAYTMITEAAEAAGITVSAWVTERLLAAAKRERKAE